MNEDAQVSAVALQACAHDSEIPMSEMIRKEFFYKCFNNFTQALAASPALFAEQVRAQCLRYSILFAQHNGTKPMETIKFTAGDYRRFSALVYLFTRKILMACDLMMGREKKKRLMPRHIMVAMVSLGLIPYNIIRSMPLSEKDQEVFT